MIEGIQQINALHCAVFGVVKMPCVQGIFPTVRFFLDSVVKDQHAIKPLDLSHGWLYELPEYTTGEIIRRKQPGKLVMAISSIQQLSRTRCRGLAKRRQQIIRIEIDKVIFHAAYNASFPVGA